jgi:ketosteroid isomerase-like protein
LQAIEDVVRRAHEAQEDVQALVALYTDEAVIVNLAGRRVFGAAALTEAMTAALASPFDMCAPAWRSSMCSRGVRTARW